MAVVVRVDQAAIEAYIRAPNGPIMRRMMVAAEAVKVATIASLREGFPRDFLGATIVKRVVNSPGGARVRVGSEHTHTQPHVIRGNPLLFFMPTKGQYAGKLISVHMVNHPGSNFDDYLGAKLREALPAIRGAL